MWFYFEGIKPEESVLLDRIDKENTFDLYQYVLILTL
jgi:hypothetical protein